MKYSKGLDGLRGLAIILVILHHFFGGYIYPNTIWSKLFSIINDNGWIGVDLFFVLSGFLISSILIKNPNFSIKSFYIRRILRIFPVYYFTVAAVFFLPAIFGSCDINPAIFITYLQNYAIPSTQGWGGGSLLHTWSLAIEEQYYLIIPFIILITPSKYYSRIFGSIILVSLLTRFVLYVFHFDWGYSFMWTITRMDSFAFGGLLSILTIMKAEERQLILSKLKNHLGVAIFLSLSFILFNFYYYGYINRHGFMYPILYSCINVIIVFGLYKILHLKKTVFENPILVQTGKHSYGLYLFHYPLLFALREAEIINYSLQSFLVFILIISGISILSKRYFEDYFIKLKRNYPY